jgi:4-hydroxy-3-polyprenylbenzoate decarboxylase
MVFESLREYIEVLEHSNNLKRVKSKVSVDLEMGEILRRLVYNNGPAVLFENVDGFNMKVLGNAFGSIERMKIALQLDRFEEIGERIAALTKLDLPSNILDKLKMLPKLSEITDQAPKIINKGPVMENIVKDPNLLSLPALKSWPKDAGRFITFGLVLTKHPITGVRNLGVYRIQLVDEKRAIMHWQIHKRGAQHFLMQEGKIDVAIIIGADPATIFSAVAPVPEGLDKYLFAGIVRKKGLRLVKCNTIDLEVPAEAEIVLEGYVDNNMLIEGPFGDHTGYYTPPEPYPTFHLTSIMHRDDPIYLTTVVGKPVVEDAYIGKVIERSFLPLIRVFHPEVIDFSMPPAGWFQGLAIVSIKKKYPGQAKKVMLGLWGLGQLSLTKIIVVVDHDINVNDMNDVIWAITTRVDPRRDIIIIDNTPTDTLDPASPLLNLGSKLGIDATQKWREEGYNREVQELATIDEKTKELVDRRWKEYGLE